LDLWSTTWQLDSPTPLCTSVSPCQYHSTKAPNSLIYPTTYHLRYIILIKKALLTIHAHVQIFTLNFQQPIILVRKKSKQLGHSVHKTRYFNTAVSVTTQPDTETSEHRSTVPVHPRTVFLCSWVTLFTKLGISTLRYL